MIDVIIPFYNQAEYLDDCLSSVFSQTKKADNVWLINDGSTEEWKHIAKKYPVTILNQVNKGLASARNTGLMNSKAKYILPLDADDMLMENAIEKIMQKFEEIPMADIVAPSFKNFGVMNDVVTLQKAPLDAFLTANRIGYFSAYRRELAIQIGGYNHKMVYGWEDWDFWIDMIKNGAWLEVIHEPLVLYRTKKNSMYTESVKHSEYLSDQMRKNHPELKW